MTSDCGCKCSTATCMADMRLAALGPDVAGTCVLVPGEGKRKVSATVSADDAVAGLRFEAEAGTHKGIQLVVDTDEGKVRLFDEAENECACEIPDGDVRLAAMVDVNTVSACVNGVPLGTMTARKPDALEAFVVCTGTGGASFSSICTELVE